MIKVRCFKCGHAYHLTEQYVANELAAQGITRKPALYVAECPRCRQANKVSLKRVRLPQPETGPSSPSEDTSSTGASSEE
jgi:Zn ribbon nucleic-acid-binding protein